MKFKGANNVTIKRISRTAIAATALLVASQISLGADSSGIRHAFAEQPVVSFGGGSDAVQSPLVQPAWSIKIKPWDQNQSYPTNLTITGEGKVFVFSGQSLIAIQAQSGKKLWTYGTNLQPVVAYHNGVVYGSTSDGKIFALSASTGKRLWLSSINIANPSAIQAIGNTLFVMNVSETHAFQLKTGKKLWTNIEQYSDWGGDTVIESGDVILRSFLMPGASTSTQLNAIDKKTGKKLWGIYRQGAPIKIEGDLVYSILDNYVPNLDNPERNVTVSVINLKTGVVKGSRIYRWSAKPRPDGSTEYGGLAYLDGDDFYIHRSGIVAKYDFNHYKADAQPVKTYNDLKDSSSYSPLMKVHRGRILYINNTNQTPIGIKTVNGQRIGWYGDNPSAQTDIYGKGVYLAQTDGFLHAVDFDSGKPQFRVKTDARSYGPTLKEGGSLIIQTNGRLIGVQLPAALK